MARQLTAIGNLQASRGESKNTWIVGHKPLFAYNGSRAVANGIAQPPEARTWQFQKAIVPLAKNPQSFSSSPIQNAGKKESAIMSEFSFLVLDRLPGVTATGAVNWQFQAYDINRKLLRTCTTSGKTTSCDG